MSYDYIIVGSGLYGSVVAYELSKMHKKVLVIDKRSTVGGNVYTENVDGIQVHKYGAHIFRTNDKYIWDYMNAFSNFLPFINSPIAINGKELYNLPFNMNTFTKMWKVQTPEQVKQVIERQTAKYRNVSPSNLEEFALATVGPDIYEKLIKGYTEKQWGKKCNELPISVMKRIPIRYTFDNNYYQSRYQGIPESGYTSIITQMLKDCDVLLSTDGREYLHTYGKEYAHADTKVIYTGCIDEAMNYILGKLEYRSLYFEEIKLDTDNFQGNAVVNYTSADVPYTRIIEHKHFTGIDTNFTIISKEYPITDGEPYYPIETCRNLSLYGKYLELSKSMENIIFCGRLGNYKYTDMEETVKNALRLSHLILGGKI